MPNIFFIFLFVWLGEHQFRYLLITPRIHNRYNAIEKIETIEEQWNMLFSKNLYNQINKEIRYKCYKAKEEWLNKKCNEIETHHHGNARDMYKQIKELTNKRTYNKTGCLKSKEGHTLMDRNEIMTRWCEYIRELYEDNRGEIDIRSNKEGPPILKAEVEEAINHMKNNKKHQVQIKSQRKNWKH